MRFQDKLLIFLQRQIQSIEILGIISLLILILVLLFPFIQKIWIRYQNNYQLENPPAVFIDYIFFFLISFCGLYLAIYSGHFTYYSEGIKQCGMMIILSFMIWGFLIHFYEVIRKLELIIRKLF